MAFFERINTTTRELRIALTMEAPQLAPGRMSRGAAQQRIFRASRYAHVASAMVLSFDEWLMKTSCAMAKVKLLARRFPGQDAVQPRSARFPQKLTMRCLPASRQRVRCYS